MRLFQSIFSGFFILFLLRYSDAADSSTVQSSSSSKEALLETQKKIEEELNSLEENIKEEEQRVDETEQEIKQERAEKKIESEDEIHEEIDELKEDLNETREELKEYIDEVKEDIEEEQEERTDRKKGGAFVLTTGITWLDKDPFKELNKKELSLKSKEFDFDNNKTLMLGLNGYYEVENGMRLGNSLSAGYKVFQSDPYTCIFVDSLSDSIPVDSIVTLRVIPAYFGFICEKAFLFPYFNIFAGFMIGGGATVVLKTGDLSSGSSAFINDDTNSSENPKVSVAVAPAFMWDLHVGTAVSLSESFHIGFEGQSLFAYVHDGFGPGYKGIVTVSPGLRIRLIFGKDSK